MEIPDRLCWANGEYLSLREARVHPWDLAVTRGYGVFDFIQSKSGKPFQLRAHFDRLLNSASLLDLEVPVGWDEFETICRKLIEAAGLPEFTIRAILTGGVSPDSLAIDKPNFLILLEDELLYPVALFQNGGSLATMAYRRYLPEAKTLNYLPAVRMRNRLRSKGVTEVLFVDGDEVLEASTSNFFAFVDGTWVTPKDGILPGITRQIVLEAADGVIPVEERRLTTAELSRAEEAFICSTSKDILPIVRIDDRPVGAGVVGPRTREFMDRFREYALSD